MCPTRGDSARTGRILGRHKNDEYAAVTPARPAFQRHEAHAEGSDTAPTQKCRKNAKREFNHLPQQGSRRNPVKRFRREEDERQRERVLPLAAGRGIRRPLGRRRATERASPAACGGTRDSSSARTTASIAFVWSAAKPLPCQMHWAGHGPTPPSCGQKPTPTQSCERFCGNAFTRLRRRSFKGGPVPL